LAACSQFAAVWAAMQQAAQAQPQAPDQEHGGALDGSGNFEPLSKHAGDITGAPDGRRTM
jgi:hypothetical protein